MKRVMKWIGIGIVVLLSVLVVGAVIGQFTGQNRVDKAPEVATRPVAAATDAASMARGEHLVNAVAGCRMCHGDNLEGQPFLEDEMGINMPAPNLTSGAGGVGATYSDADWELALRHGIGGDGRVLAIMPSSFYAHFSDEDLAAVIGYLKSVPPVDNELGGRTFGFPGGLMALVGFNEFTHLGRIDHANVGTFAPPEGATADYGQYLVSVASCRECHGSNLAGITGENGPPPGPNLTPGGELAGWTEADFITALRSGQTPEGEQLDGEQMPWPLFGQMSDTELQAIWAYLHSLPALADGAATGGG